MTAPRRQRGVALITAIFIITVLAALGAFLVQVTFTQQATVTGSVQGARAFFAAQSGMERLIRTVLLTGACPVSLRTYALNGGATVGFQVEEVRCTPTVPQPVEGGVTYDIFDLEVRATFGSFTSPANPDFVQRRIRATVTNSP